GVVDGRRVRHHDPPQFVLTGDKADRDQIPVAGAVRDRSADNPGVLVYFRGEPGEGGRQPLRAVLGGVVAHAGITSAAAGNSLTIRSAGQRSQSPPLEPAPSFRPSTLPSCLTNTAVPVSWHCSTRNRAQPSVMRLAPGPDSPPTITQSSDGPGVSQGVARLTRGPPPVGGIHSPGRRPTGPSRGSAET